MTIPAIPDWLDGKARVLSFEQKRDERGTLTPIEFHALPFAPRRVFYVTGASAGMARGGHGHRTGERLLLCAAGEVKVELRVAGCAHTVVLRPDGVGLLVGAGVWMEETYLSANSVLSVLTDLRFEEEEYFHEP